MSFFYPFSFDVNHSERCSFALHCLLVWIWMWVLDDLGRGGFLYKIYVIRLDFSYSYGDLRFPGGIPKTSDTIVTIYFVYLSSLLRAKDKDNSRLPSPPVRPYLLRTIVTLTA